MNEEQAILDSPTVDRDHYAGIAERFKAIILDGFVIISFMITMMLIFSFIGDVSQYIKASVFLLIVVLYDPLFTTLFGGTLGHMMSGIRVKRESDETKNIIFPLAVLRYILKLILGWISLLVIPASSKKRAIHDAIAGSVVLIKD